MRLLMVDMDGMVKCLRGSWVRIKKIVLIVGYLQMKESDENLGYYILLMSKI